MTLLDDVAPVTARERDGQGLAWVDVCGLDDLVFDRGVCALIGGQPVAVFRCWPDGEVHAVGNVDPFSGASVLSRGIVGSIGDRPFVASPVYKHRFDLRTGASFDDPYVVLPVYATRIAR